MIELKDIHKTYFSSEVSQHVLKGIDLHVKEREFVCVMGASGSGKSTLLNILGMLDSFDEGEYLLDGVSVKTLGRNERARVRGSKIGFVFQKNNLIDFKTAAGNIELPMIYNGLDKSERDARVSLLLSRVGLEDMRNKYPYQLSGGQQQRVAIARAMALNPKLILADEPTGALDSRTSQEMMDLFLSVNREYGMTMVMVTHEESLARQAKRIISVKDGNLVDDIAL